MKNWFMRLFGRSLKDRSLQEVADHFKIWRVPAPAFEHTLDADTNLVDDPHFGACAVWLQGNAPIYLSKLFHGLVNSVRDLKKFNEEVTELETQFIGFQDDLIHVMAEAKGAGKDVERQRLTHLFHQVLKLPSSKTLDGLKVTAISMGLSLAVGLALTELFDIDFNDPPLVVALAGGGLFFAAISVNLSTQRILQILVCEQRLERAAALGAGEMRREPRPFWVEMLHGNNAIWLGFSFVVMEALSAAYFVSQRIPIHSRVNAFAVGSVFAIAAYFAYLNVSMAYTEGLHRYRQMSADMQQKEEYDLSRNAQYGDQMYDLRGKQRAATVKAAQIKIKLREQGKKLKWSQREYRKSRKAVVRLSQAWFRALPYLLAKMHESGASQDVIHGATHVVDNGHRLLSGHLRDE